MDERTPLLKIEDGIAYLTMNRPETLNSFTGDFLFELYEAIAKADSDPSAKVILLTGQGRGFTSGGNLGELKKMNKDRQTAIYDVDLTADMVRLLYNVKKPVVAAVNGPVFGAGIAMMMACDIIIASERAQIGYSFSNLGFCPDSGATWFLAQKVGYNKAAEILFTGRTIGAQEALALGLVNKVVAHDELLTEAGKLAKRLANGPAMALMLQKRVLRNAVTTTFEQNRDYEAVTQIFASQTDDCAEGIASALEKRKPEFKGR